MSRDDGPSDRPSAAGGANGEVPSGDSNKPAAPPTARLKLARNKDHKPERYDDLQLDFSPAIFSSLEGHLPEAMLGVSRDDKVKFMREILLKYLPHGERNRVQNNLVEDLFVKYISLRVIKVDISDDLGSLGAQRHKDYRQKILDNYQPLHRNIYTMDPASFFDDRFREAVRCNTKDSFETILSQPSPGVYTFQMFKPHFCQLLLNEVANFEKWVGESKFRIMRPNTMNKYGAVLDDFGFEKMLDKLMMGFIRPMSTVFFPEVGGSSLDSHHGFVVEYGEDRDLDLGFHVDDSEVTLNVCLGKEFKGGELFFRGTRCDKHVNTGSHPEEIFDYVHEPGRAVLHRGRHRHGARATTSGHRVNLLLWCRSSNYREMKKYQKDFSSWCGECSKEKQEQQRESFAMKSKLLNNEEMMA